jgi:hypothetical protein
VYCESDQDECRDEKEGKSAERRKDGERMEKTIKMVLQKTGERNARYN